MIMFPLKSNSKDLNLLRNTLNYTEQALELLDTNNSNNKNQKNCAFNNKGTNFVPPKNNVIAQEQFICSKYLHDIVNTERNSSLFGAIPNSTNHCDGYKNHKLSKADQLKNEKLKETNLSCLNNLSKEQKNDRIEKGQYVLETLNTASEKIMLLKLEITQLKRNNNFKNKAKTDYCDTGFSAQMVQKCLDIFSTNDELKTKYSCQGDSRSEILKQSKSEWKNAFTPVVAESENEKLQQQVKKDSVIKMYPWLANAKKEKENIDNQSLENEFDGYLQDIENQLDTAFLNLQDLGRCSTGELTGARCLQSGPISNFQGYYEGMALARQIIGPADNSDNLSVLTNTQNSRQECIHEMVFEQKNTAKVIGTAVASSLPGLQLSKFINHSKFLGTLGTRFVNGLSQMANKGSLAISNISTLEVMQNTCGTTPQDLNFDWLDIIKLNENTNITNTNTSNNTNYNDSQAAKKQQTRSCQFSKLHLNQTKNMSHCFLAATALVTKQARGFQNIITAENSNKLKNDNNKGNATESKELNTDKNSDSKNKYKKRYTNLDEKPHFNLMPLRPKDKAALKSYFVNHQGEVSIQSKTNWEASEVLQRWISKSKLSYVAVHDAVKLMSFKDLNKNFNYPGVPANIINNLSAELKMRLKNIKKSADGQYCEMDVLDQLDILWGKSKDSIQADLKAMSNNPKNKKQLQALAELWDHTVNDVIGKYDDLIGSNVINHLTTKEKVALRLTEFSADLSVGTGNSLTSHEMGQSVKTTAQYVQTRKDPLGYLLYKLSPTNNPDEIIEAQNLIQEMGGLDKVYKYFDVCDAKYMETRKIMHAYNQTMSAPQVDGAGRTLFNEGEFIPIKIKKQ